MFRILFETLILMCIGLSGQMTYGQPGSPALMQWKQSIERPAKGWDYDGKQILGHVGYDICLWDAATGKLLQRMKEHNETIKKVQFIPDGEHALSSSWISPGPMTDLKSKETRTIVWNLTTGRSVHLFPGQVAGEFSPDGTRISTFSQRPGTSSSFDAAAWEVLTGRELVKVKLDDGSGPYWDALHYSPDGRNLVVPDYRPWAGKRGNGVVEVRDWRRYTNGSRVSLRQVRMTDGSVSWAATPESERLPPLSFLAMTL